MFWDNHSDRSFHRVQMPLKHLVFKSYWHVYRARSVLRRWTKHHQGGQDPLLSCSWTTGGTSLNIFPCQMGWVYALSGFSMSRAEVPLQRCTWKSNFLGTSSLGLFRTPSERISRCIYIVRTSCSQLSARSRISAFLLRLFTDPVAWNLCTQR